MTDRTRVVVTGIGPVTPIGITREGLWDGLRRQQSAVRAITRFDASMLRTQIAAEINDFHADDFIELKRLKRRSEEPHV